MNDFERKHAGFGLELWENKTTPGEIVAKHRNDHEGMVLFSPTKDFEGQRVHCGPAWFKPYTGEITIKGTQHNENGPFLPGDEIGD